VAKGTRCIKLETVQTVVERPFVKLELSPEEAQFLADVLAKIGGDPVTTRRKHQLAISGALRDAGHNFTWHSKPRYGEPARDITGNLGCTSVEP
jgi:hypothetical protein